ncbi:hypothetical protein [Streptomyces sp. NPDC008141]|uniref:hypothetical protein n=1 Tax=Streptomyces sp. NPDC008141 TaxID=3364815 RepID=UPI0036ED4274
MTFRSRHLEELLDGTLDAITYADIAALDGNPDAAEVEDLDSQQAHHTSEAKREALTKDVAAIAKHMSCVLNIGMRADTGQPTLRATPRQKGSRAFSLVARLRNALIQGRNRKPRSPGCSIRRRGNDRHGLGLVPWRLAS